MTEREALGILQRHNRWRRGDNSIEMADPRAIGLAIDVACHVLAEHLEHEKEKTNDSTNRPHRKGRRV